MTCDEHNIKEYTQRNILGDKTGTSMVCAKCGLTWQEIRDDYEVIDPDTAQDMREIISLLTDTKFESTQASLEFGVRQLDDPIADVMEAHIHDAAADMGLDAYQIGVLTSAIDNARHKLRRLEDQGEKL